MRSTDLTETYPEMINRVMSFFQLHCGGQSPLVDGADIQRGLFFKLAPFGSPFSGFGSSKMR